MENKKRNFFKEFANSLRRIDTLATNEDKVDKAIKTFHDAYPELKIKKAFRGVLIETLNLADSELEKFEKSLGRILGVFAYQFLEEEKIVPPISLLPVTMRDVRKRATLINMLLRAFLMGISFKQVIDSTPEPYKSDK